MRYHHFETFLMDVCRSLPNRLYELRATNLIKRQWFMVSHIVREIRL